MGGQVVSTGRVMRSVALRYRQPTRWWAGVSGASGHICRFLSGHEPPDDVLQGSGPYARSRAMARLEAVLLLGEQPQTSRKLAQLVGLADGTRPTVDGDEALARVRARIDQLNK